MDYSFLKSGSDIRGVASCLGGKEVELTENAVFDITSAFVLWLSQKYNKPTNSFKISIGHDSRITAESITETVSRALVGMGVCVLRCGLASTPAMFMTTIDLDTDAAIQITASHHPFDRNGLKFFVREGGLEGSDISEIVKIAGELKLEEYSKGSITDVDYMTTYAKRLRKLICDGVGKLEEEKPLKDFRIIVDAGNGAGGFYANEVLKPLGADISGSQFLEPDGMFPNHIPNPENKTAMDSICDAVKRNRADLGLIFDTDVDRAGCVDKTGTEINRNRLIALASYIALQGNECGTIVTDSVTSDGLKLFIENNLCAKHYRYRRGYRNVINKAIELCGKGENCPLAIETSGHAALRENYFLDDGAYLVTKIVIELAKGKDFSKILSSLKMPIEERELRLKIKAQNFREYGEMVIEKLTDFANSCDEFVVANDNREGVRVSTANGWFLLRVSVHDPVMPMNFESNICGGIDNDISKILPFLRQFDLLDLTCFD